MASPAESPGPDAKRRFVDCLKWAVVELKWAVVKTAPGLVLGCITAGVLVLLTATVFSELQEVGQDMGLRLGVHLQRLDSTVSGRPVGEEALERGSFLFVDVDPEHGLVAPPAGADESEKELATGSQRACSALVKEFPEHYQLAIKTLARPASGADSTANKPKPLNCGSSRPLNRHLLAELVRELAARSARIIVLDVVLATEHGVIDEQENEALRQALRERASSQLRVPVLYADPVEAASPSQQTRDEFVRLDTLNTFTIEPSALVRSAVALPSPGHPLRRYPKCLFLLSGEGKRVPTLPFLAAQMLTTPGLAHDTPCPAATPDAPDDTAKNAPRIVYTLPPLESHQDDTLSPARARWAIYQPVYNRCLAANFWDKKSGSACVDRRMYEGKVVVVGASNPVRRDRHYTPLGDMAGAEVVINAIRSFASYPTNRDKAPLEVFCKDLVIVFACTGVWFGYFLIAAQISRKRRSWRWVLSPLAFLFALFAACLLAVFMSYDRSGPVPSLGILIPVLAIGVDAYVHWTSEMILRPTKRFARRFLRLPDAGEHH